MYVLRYDQNRAMLIGPFTDSNEAVRWMDVVNVENDPRWAIVANPEVQVVEPLSLARVSEVIVSVNLSYHF